MRDSEQVFAERARSQIRAATERLLTYLAAPPRECAFQKRLNGWFRAPARSDDEPELRAASRDAQEHLSRLAAPMAVYAGSLDGAFYGWRNADRERHARLLQLTPRLEYFFVFSGDGRLRQAALEKLQGPLPGAFYVVALALRLNDWAAPVREAANQCARRTLPVTDPQALSEAAFFLLDRMRHWRRWGDVAKPLLDAFTRRDVADRLADRFRDARTGAIARRLQQTLRSDALDHRLGELAERAFLPHVRALATKTLLDRQATWQTGTQWRWIDKRYGVRRRVPCIEARAIAATPPREALIARAARDKSAFVRKTAAEALVTWRDELPEVTRLAALFAADRRARVRSPAEYLLQKKAGDTTVAPAPDAGDRKDR